MAGKNAYINDELAELGITRDLIDQALESIDCEGDGSAEESIEKRSRRTPILWSLVTIVIFLLGVALR